MSVVAAIRSMLAAGLTIEQALTAAEAFETNAAPKRTARQERNRRYYERKKASETVSKSSESSYSDDQDALVPPDGPSLPPGPPTHPLNPPPKKSRAREASPRDELLTVLDEARAGAVLDHRQRLRKPLTAHAAHLLAGKLSKVDDPNAAADEMIARGWLGFEPDWLENGSPRGRGPPPRSTSANGFASLLAREIRDEQASQHRDRHDDERPGRAGSEAPTLDLRPNAVPSGHD